MRTQIFPKFYSTQYSTSRAASWLDAFSAWHRSMGYCRTTLRSHVCVLRRVLEARVPLPLDTQFSDTDLRYLFATQTRRKQFAGARWAFKRFLCDRGQWIDTPLRGRHASLIDLYAMYLKEIRGLAPATIDQQLRMVREFLNKRCAASRQIGELTLNDVESFIAMKGRRVGRLGLQGIVGALRSFLRYCHDRKLLQRRLDEIDRPRRFRDERPPRAMAWSDTQRLLHSIDRRSRLGCRDHAILYLMAHFGLRPGELTQLLVNDVDLGKRVLRVPQSKTHQVLSLPLGHDTAKVLKRYLKFGRPRTDRYEVFLSATAPMRPMQRNAIAAIFNRRVQDAGLTLAGRGAYSLRHGFAMRLLERGVGIKTIGDLLGHHSLESTCVYLRLNTEALRDVALPVPRAHLREATGGAL